MYKWWGILILELVNRYFIIISLVTLFSIPEIVQAQDSSANMPTGYFYSTPFEHAFRNPGKRSLVQLESNYQMSSTSITSELGNTFLFGGFIDQEMKDNAWSKMKEKNNFGIYLNNRLSFATRSADGSMTWFGSLKAENNAGLKITDDAFRLVFYGNALTSGDSSLITGLNLDRWQYNQVQFGGIKSFESGENSVRIGAALSFVQSGSYFDLKVNKGTFYTEEDGRYIDLNYNLEAKYSDTSSFNILDFHGVGGAIDLHFEMEQKGNYLVAVDIGDLGMVAFNDQTGYVDIDSSIRFEGLEVTDIFAFDEAFSSNNVADSLLNEIGFQDSKGKRTVQMRPWWQIRITKAIASLPMSFSMGIRHKVTAGYSPMFFGKLNYSFSPLFSAGIWSSYGGFGRFNAGAEIDAYLADMVVVQLGSQGLWGYLSPANGTTQSVFARIAVQF